MEPLRSAKEEDVWKELSDTVAAEERTQAARPQRRSSLADRLREMARPRSQHARAGYEMTSGGPRTPSETVESEFGLMLDDDGDDSPRSAWEAPPANLDVWTRSLYMYYYNRGFRAIVATHLSSLTTLAFSVAFSTFLVAFLDWGALMECEDEDTCHHLSHYVSNRSLAHPSTLDVVAFGYFVLFSVYFVLSVLSFLAVLRESMEMRRFYVHKLNISERDLQTMQWSDVVARVVELQESGRCRLQVTKAVLTEHDIVSRIMRKENYLIAFVNKKLLPLTVRVPLLGTTPPLFTKSFEALWHFTVFNHMFSDKFAIRRQFLNEPERLKRRMRYVGAVNLLLLPFILMFLVMHFFLKHAKEWHHAKEYLGPRQWTPLALWQFREFQELPHVFEQRINSSYEPADAYQRQFPAPVTTVVARCVAFITGSFVAVLLMLTLVDEAMLLYIHIGDRNLFWYITVFSGLFAITRAAVPKPRDRVFAPEEAMMELVKLTHYLPDAWRGRCHTYDVRDRFLRLFPYKAALFGHEMVAAVLSPYLFMVQLPHYVPDMLHFVQDVTVDVDGVGAVCGYSAFDFDKFGDHNYGAPAAAGAASHVRLRSAGGKMEKSFLNFAAQHPRWRGPEAARQFKETVEDFAASESRSQMQQTMSTISELAGAGAGAGAPDLAALPSLSALGSALGAGAGAGSQSRLAATLTQQQHEENFYWLEKYFEAQSGGPIGASFLPSVVAPAPAPTLTRARSRSDEFASTSADGDDAGVPEEERRLRSSSLGE